ncbi:MAG: RNA polymerase Rpb4 family protein [Candidatus Methanolliviera hydrocarbonicum]|mgnify:CR=1 FL=1|uniref:DNA-directed RNA polymerase subunit Rpo4 n=1 Tax=Candidatus Methanolliviera hydrocarbonicum TaxID=2491085 RepID=A0A520KXR8_9EURY|nr:MAG: RNA polymerase Rpb4 family protein [Candidatus Methanolliviera hydrocarbonicum]
MVKVKEVLDTCYLTNVEAQEILGTIAEENKDKELFYEQKRAIDHARKFNKLGVESAKALIEELLKLEKMNRSVAVVIANILPRARDELRSIYAKERFTLSEKEMDEILDIVARYKDTS